MAEKSETNGVQTYCPRCDKNFDGYNLNCPQCGISLLVDVRPHQPVGDKRKCYLAAKRLAEEIPIRKFQEYKDGLSRKKSPGITELSQDNAEKIQSILRELEIDSYISSQDTRAPLGFRITPASLAVGGLLLTLIVGGTAWFLWSRDGGEAETSSPQEAAKPAAKPSEAKQDPDKPLSARQIADMVVPASATLQCDTSQGSGFFIGPNQLITNDHVLCENGNPIKVILNDGTKLVGRTMKRDHELDIALVKVRGAKAIPLQLGDATNLFRGDTVYALGNPLGMDFTLTKGIISHPNRPVMGFSHLQIDANINSGNSGGPLMDERGKVVGIVSKQMGYATGLGLAIPANYLYAGAHAVLKADVAYNSKEWSERHLDAQIAWNKEKAKIKDVNGKLIPVRAIIWRKEVAVQLYIHTLETPPTLVELYVDVEGQDRCSVTGKTDGWYHHQSNPSIQAGDIPLEPLHTTTMHFPVATCPAIYSGSAELVVPNGHPERDRIKIEVIGQ